MLRSEIGIPQRNRVAFIGAEHESILHPIEPGRRPERIALTQVDSRVTQPWECREWLGSSPLRQRSRRSGTGHGVSSAERERTSAKGRSFRFLSVAEGWKARIAVIDLNG
jgi:hypothetical protein